MKRKMVDSYCFIIISKCYDIFFTFYSALNTIKSNLRQYDLLEYVKDNTSINICHYSVCVIYNLFEVVDLPNC